MKIDHVIYKMTHILSPAEALGRAISDYLNLSRNRHTYNLYSEETYLQAEEAAWEKLQRAIEAAANGNEGTAEDFALSLDKQISGC